jgi:hypothetical protein
MNTCHSIALFVFAAATVVACGHEYSETSSTTTTGAVASSPVNQQAIDAIAATRCAREARCDNVGAGKHYVSRQGCMTQLRGEGMNDLTTTACPHGLDNAQLDKCLADIRGERCENVLDTIARLSSCSRSSLCSR